MIFKVKVLKGYYFTTLIPEASDLFRQINLMKLVNYSTSQMKGYLPIDVDDFYCDHIAVCDALTDKVLMCVNIVTKSQSEMYENVEFPITKIVNTYLTKYERHKVHKLITTLSKGNFGYSGGWSIHSSITERKTREELKTILCGLHYQYHIENNIVASFGCGIPQSGTMQFFKERWGYETIINREIQLLGLNGVFVKLMYQLTDLMPESKKAAAKQIQSMWNDRVEFDIQEESRRAV